VGSFIRTDRINNKREAFSSSEKCRGALTTGITAPEYWEYQKRKAQAETEKILGLLGLAIGFLLLLVAGISLSVEGPLGMMGMKRIEDVHAVFVSIFILLASGAIAYWDGNEKLEKIKHIYWTKQALREYEQTKHKVLDSAQEQTYNYNYCPRCGKPIGPADKFCLHCGVRMDNFKKGISLGQSQSPIETEMQMDDDLASQEERILKFLETLDEKLIEGKINESTYDELKSKYEAKLAQAKEIQNTITINQNFVAFNCPRCDAYLKPDATFCEKCGVKFLRKIEENSGKSN